MQSPYCPHNFVVGRVLCEVLNGAAVTALVVVVCPVVVVLVVVVVAAVVVFISTRHGGRLLLHDLPAFVIVPMQHELDPPGIEPQVVPPQPPHLASQQALPARIPVEHSGSDFEVLPDVEGCE